MNEKPELDIYTLEVQMGSAMHHELQEISHQLHMSPSEFTREALLKQLHRWRRLIDRQRAASYIRQHADDQAAE